jgi:hypothetical protein
VQSGNDGQGEVDPDDAAYIGRRDDLIVTAARTLNVGTLA